MHVTVRVGQAGPHEKKPYLISTYYNLSVLSVSKEIRRVLLLS